MKEWLTDKHLKWLSRPVGSRADLEMKSSNLGLQGPVFSLVTHLAQPCPMWLLPEPQGFPVPLLCPGQLLPEPSLGLRTIHFLCPLCSAGWAVAFAPSSSKPFLHPFPSSTACCQLPFTWIFILWLYIFFMEGYDSGERGNNIFYMYYLPFKSEVGIAIF